MPDPDPDPVLDLGGRRDRPDRRSRPDRRRSTQLRVGVGTGAAAHPDRATGALAVALAAIAAALVATHRAPPVLPAPAVLSPLVLGVGLAVLFCLTDLSLLHVEVRRQAYSVTLAGLPLTLGVLLSGPRELLAARIVGSAVAFTLQRAPVRKAG